MVIRRRWAWLDWLDGTDPGLMRLQMATEITVTIGVVLAAEWLFVRGTGALGDFGWLAAEVGIGVAGTLLVHFTLFYPRPGAAVRRMQRSYSARFALAIGRRGLSAQVTTAVGDTLASIRAMDFAAVLDAAAAGCGSRSGQR